MEVDLVADILDYSATHGQRLLEAQELPGEPGATVVSEPIGVIPRDRALELPVLSTGRVAVPQCALAFA
jgi:succinate-semialdehyde dehydrogenase/glutarate-semialdehyde dehydrogenase